VRGISPGDEGGYGGEYHIATAEFHSLEEDVAMRSQVAQPRMLGAVKSVSTIRGIGGVVEQRNELADSRSTLFMFDVDLHKQPHTVSTCLPHTEYINPGPRLDIYYLFLSPFNQKDYADEIVLVVQ
jgi:hypothetical protein